MSRRRLLIIALILVVGTGIIITAGTIQAHESELREQLITQVRLASVGLNSSDISRIPDQIPMAGTGEYRAVKHQMGAIASSSDLYRFAYLMVQKPDGTIIFLADSEEPNSPDYSPPGQEYSEAPPTARDIFQTGEEVVEGPYTDRWGTFVSGYVPISRPGEEEIVAVLGVDAYVTDWDQEVMKSAIVPALMTLLLVTILISLIIINHVFETEEARRAESDERLRKSEEQLREAQKNARIGIFDYHPKTGSLTCTPETYGILGIPGDEAGSFSQVCASVFRNPVADTSSRDVYNPIPSLAAGAAVRYDHPDGKVRWLNVIANPEPVGEGDEARIHGTVQDITDLHQIQENLRRDEERLRLLVRNSSDIIMVIDEDKTCRYVSDSIERVIGFSPEEFLHQPFTPQMIYPDDYAGVSRLLDDLMATPGIQRRLVYRHRHKTDGYVYLETIGTNLLDDPVIHGIILNSRDFSEIKKAEEKLLSSLSEIKERNRDLEEIRAQMIRVNDGLEERVRERTRDLEESKEQVEQLLIQKDQFIYQIAHDLRTPLTPVVAMLPLLIIGITDPDSKSLLEIFHKSIQYLQKMVEDIVLYTQLNRQYSITDYAEYNLHTLIASAVEANSFPAEQKEITIVMDIPEEIIIRLSKSHASQLFRNLINNAVKYNNFKGSITITAAEEREGVSVSIQDTGVGIDPDLMDKIWDEFTTGDPARRDPEAKGLGLAIVRRIIVLHGGRIQCSSEGTGKGSTFTLYLPYHFNHQDQQPLRD